MKTDSDNYPTYAEYARRSLLRLRVVNGLSDELIAANKRDDITIAVIQGVLVDVLIDSGSTISLVSESVAKHLQCTQTPSVLILRAIGSQEVETSFRTTLAVEFPEITLEVDFHIVPDRFLSLPVIVGTDVLNREGVAYVSTRGVQRITGVDKINTIQSNVLIDTPLTGEDLERLMSGIN